MMASEMNEIDLIAADLRHTYGEHEGEKWVDWENADEDKKSAWRAIAERAYGMGARGASQ